MARQRFIWPKLWKDPDFGSLTPQEQLFFIACFSLADDDGRIEGEPAYLRAEMFPYSRISVGKMRAIRDSVAEKMRSVHVYTVDDRDYIALLKWSIHQKPKYPQPSRIPPPFPEPSPNGDGTQGDTSPTGRDGLGRVNTPPTPPCEGG